MKETGEKGTLTFQLLGKPKIQYKSQSLTEALAQKEQALLIYLAYQAGQRFSRDHLATLLWSETSPSNARYNLRRALWRIRRELDQFGIKTDAFLSTNDTWISIPAIDHLWVDAQAFESIIQSCLNNLEAQTFNPLETQHPINKAIDLYQGDFLTGFSVHNAPSFDEWLIIEREHLFLTILRALTSLIQSFIAWGEREKAIDTCQHLLNLDPLQEDIHRLLMRLYWETGQRAKALRQYNTYRELLERELDIEPLEETYELYQRILQQETSPTSISSLTLTSRLTHPSPPPEALDRPRLLSLLDQGLKVPLTLLSAPPGYGKTTLLAQWLDALSNKAEKQGMVFAWYKVSETDNNPLTFIEGVATALARLHPALGEALREVYNVTALQGDPHRAIGLLVNALASTDSASFIIIFDDMERLKAPDSQDILRFLLRHLPPNGHIYLLTRVIPSLPLPRLRIRGQLVEISASDLQFTPEEVSAYLEQTDLNLSTAEINELISQTEGWIAPLWLAVNSLPRFASGLNDVWKGIFAYLREEVLDAQPQEVRDFLLHSAILNRLTPSLCQTLLDLPQNASSSFEWLQELERRHLFLKRIKPQTLENEPQYAYHPLFLKFLHAEASYRLPSGNVADMQKRASKAWEQQGDLKQALHYAHQAGDESRVARLLEKAAPSYFRQGRLELLAEWIDQLSPTTLREYPSLTLYTGKLRQSQGQVEEAHNLYLQAAKHAQAQQNHLAYGESLLALANLALLRGQYTDGIQFGEQAKAFWNEDDIPQQAATLCTLGHLQIYQSALPKAKSSLEEAKRLARSTNQPRLTFRILRTQAWAAYIQGTYHRAMGLSRLSEQTSDPNIPAKIAVTFLNPVPAILREWGEIEAALEITRNQIAVAHETKNYLALSYDLTDLGRLLLDQQEFEDAEQKLKQAQAESQAAGAGGIHNRYQEAILVYAHVLQGHTLEALELAEEMLRQCQTCSASPLEMAIAQTSLALAHIQSPNFTRINVYEQLLEAYQTLKRFDLRYGIFISASLLSLSHLSAENEARHQEEGEAYLAEALDLAAAESYIQTLVTSRHFLLPLLFHALQKNIEPRFTNLVLAKIGPHALNGVAELLQENVPGIIPKAIAAIEIIGAQDETRNLAIMMLEDLSQDPEARDLASQALHNLRFQKKSR